MRQIECEDKMLESYEQYKHCKILSKQLQVDPYDYNGSHRLGTAISQKFNPNYNTAASQAADFV